jgi:hypothetical protein
MVERVVGCPVVLNPGLRYEGIVRWGELTVTGYATKPLRIELREPDDRVLLHEVLHVLVGIDPARCVPVEDERHEELVRHLTTGLWDAGLRFADDPTGGERAAVVIEGRCVHGMLASEVCGECGEIAAGLSA